MKFGLKQDPWEVTVSQNSFFFDSFPMHVASIQTEKGWLAVGFDSLVSWKPSYPNGIYVLQAGESSQLPPGHLSALMAYWGVCSMFHPCSDSVVSSRHIKWEKIAFSFWQRFDKRSQSVKSDETAREVSFAFSSHLSNPSTRGGRDCSILISLWLTLLWICHIHPDTWDLYQNWGDLPEWSKDQIHFWPSRAENAPSCWNTGCDSMTWRSTLPPCFAIQSLWNALKNWIREDKNC